MASNKKISELTKQTSVGDTALFTLVSANGDNVAITVADFLSSRTLSGELQQSGPSVSTPVLDISGLQYKIRNLVAGQGITASVEAENGLQITSSLTSDQTGAEILDISEDIVKSLIAGTGISLLQGDGSITITASGVTAPTDTVIINQESDFPIQDATTITLGSQIIHQIGASFTTAKRLICQEGSLLTMNNTRGPLLTYSGTADMFTGVDVSFTMHDAHITSPNASKTFNFSETVGNTKVVTIRNTAIESTPDVGSFDGLLAVIMEVVGVDDADMGIVLNGTMTGALIKEVRMESTSASMIGVDFGTSVISSIQCENNFFSGPAGSAMIKGAASNANIPTGLLANVAFNTAAGGMSGLDTITQNDVRWFFSGNNAIRDSRTDGLLSLTSNATETVIASSGTHVLVAGTWVVEDTSQMTGTTAGRLTYNPERDTPLPITISATVLAASGGDKQLRVSLALNGSVIASATGVTTASSSKATTITVPWQIDLEEADYLELWVANDSDTTNIVVTDAVLRVN